MILSIIVILTIGVALGIEIPNKVWVSPDTGIVMEPETLAFHYDDVYYQTIGIKIDPAIDNKALQEATKSLCTLGPIRLNISSSLGIAVDTLFAHFSVQFSSLDTHICRSTEIDCFLGKDFPTYDSQGGGTMTTHKREKRFIGAALALIGGLSAIGAGIYTYISHEEVKNHLMEIESHVSGLQEKYIKTLGTQGQYNQVSESMFVKLYHGILNNENLLASTICNLNRVDDFKLTYLDMSFYIEEIKQQLHTAVSGSVTDFLISYSLLQEKILTKPDFKDSLYVQDPSLFYSLSHGVLLRADSKKKILYFMVMTPLIKASDVSPLYNILNIGWIKGGVNYKYSVPESAYFLTEKSKFEIASFSRSHCTTRNGFKLCRSREVVIDQKSHCLSNMIFNNNASTCRVSIASTVNQCSIHRFLSGVLLRSCPMATVITNFRGISKTLQIRAKPDQSLFFKNTDFQPLVVGDDIVTSKGDFIHEIIKSEIVPPNYDHEHIRHLILPGVEHDLRSLEEMNAA